MLDDATIIHTPGTQSVRDSMEWQTRSASLPPVMGAVYVTPEIDAHEAISQRESLSFVTPTVQARLPPRNHLPPRR